MAQSRRTRRLRRMPAIVVATGIAFTTWALIGSSQPAPRAQLAVPSPSTGKAADLYRTLRALTDYPHSADGLAIEKVRSAADGQIRLIVYLGGTTGPTHQLTTRGLWRDVLLYVGIRLDTSITERIDKALQGLPSATQIMLVGYSQGGMDAQTIATHWADKPHSGMISTVVTYAAPIIEPPQANARHFVFLQAQGDPVVDLTERFGTYGYSSDWAGELFKRSAGLGDTGFNIHFNPQTYINVGALFDDQTVTGYPEVKADLARFAGTALSCDQY